MSSKQSRLPHEVLLSIADLLSYSSVDQFANPRTRRESRQAVGSLYQTNKTLNHRLLPTLFPDPKWGNCEVYLAQARFYALEGKRSYLASQFISLSIHLDLPEQKKFSSEAVRERRIKHFEEITEPETFPDFPKLEKLSISSSGSMGEDLREMLVKTISLMREHIKVISLDMHSILTLFNIHPLELRLEMEVLEELVWPADLEELNFLVGSATIPTGLREDFFANVATFAFQILGGMDILEIMGQPEEEEIQTGKEEGHNLMNGESEGDGKKGIRVQQRKQKGVLRIDFGNAFFNSTAQLLKGCMLSPCLRFDPVQEELLHQQEFRFYKKSKITEKTRTPKFKIYVRGGLKVEDLEAFRARGWLLQSHAIVLEGGLKSRERSEFENQK